jgi:hypothetical protein
VQGRRFHTNDEIPEDGIYYVFHPAHRLIRTVMLCQGDRFPRCSQCADTVIFELMVPVAAPQQYEPMHIFELPMLHEEEDTAPTA